MVEVLARCAPVDTGALFDARVVSDSRDCGILESFRCRAHHGVDGDDHLAVFKRRCMNDEAYNPAQIPGGVESRADLLPQVARHDKSAVHACIARYGPLVWTMARRMSMSIEDAEDAVQEIFLDLWRHAGRFDPHHGSERVFVSTLARRRLIDRIRHMQRRLSVERPLPADLELAGISGPSEHAERDAQVDLARRVLRELPVDQQQAITLSLVEGYSHSEIAERLAWPLGTVKTVLRRGLLRLKNLAANPSLVRAAEDAE